MPAAGTRDGNHMRRLLRKRSKLLYEWWICHLRSKTLTDMLSVPGGATFQNGLNTMTQLDALFDKPANRSELRKMNTRWDELNIKDDVGISYGLLTLYDYISYTVRCGPPLHTVL